MSFLINPYSIYTPPTYTYNTRSIDGSTSTAHTFTGLNIGAADPARFVIIGVAMRNGGSISSLTIGGNAATALVTSGGNAIGSHFYGLLVPSGTTATVVVNHGTNSTCLVSSYSLYNLASTTPVSTALSSNVTPADLSSNTAIDAIVLGLVHQGNSTSTTFTWTGLTERWDETGAAPVTSWSGADGQMTTAETPRTISVSFSSPPVIYRGGALIAMK